MLRQIKIQLKHGDNSNSRYLHMDFTDKEGVAWVISRANKSLILKSAMTLGDEPELMKLTTLNPYYPIRYDDESLLEKDLRNKQKAELLRTHPCVRTVSSFGPGGVPIYDLDGNPKLRVHQFDYIDETACHIENVSVVKKFLRNMNVINQMSHSERADVMFHFGRNPIGKDNSHLFMYLIDPVEGLVLQRNRYDSVKEDGKDRVRTYMDYFYEVYDSSNKAIFLETLVKKALLIKTGTAERTIIDRRRDGSYWINDAETLGMNIAEVTNRLEREPRLLEYVRKEVERGDVLVDSEVVTMLAAKGFKEKGDGDTEEIPAHKLDKESDMRERESLFNACHKDFRMIHVKKDMPIEELRKFRDEGRDFFRMVKIKGFTKLMEANPEWNYLRMVEEYEAGMKITQGKLRKAYLMKRMETLAAKRTTKETEPA